MTKPSLSQTKKTENWLKQSELKSYPLKTYTTIGLKYRDTSDKILKINTA